MHNITKDEQTIKILKKIFLDDNSESKDSNFPVYSVMQTKRIYGIKESYRDDLKYSWVNANNPEYEIEEEDDCFSVLEEIDCEKKGNTYPWEKNYYLEIKEHVTSCFTENGCQEFIKNNNHNLCDPVIVKDSLNRNTEMIKIKKLLSLIYSYITEKEKE